jgi:hypothetical protein
MQDNSDQTKPILQYGAKRIAGVEDNEPGQTIWSAVHETFT